MMYTDLARELQRLGARHRNRIWRDRIRRRLRPAGYCCAALLLLAGAVHQLLLPLNALLVIGLAAVPALLYCGWLGVKQRPTAQQGAAAADRSFGANSLFVSAWELTRSATDFQRVEKLLLERCATTLPDWTGSSAPAVRTYLRPSTLLTMTLSMTGLLFLLQTSQVQPRQSLTTASAWPADQATTAAVKALGELLDRSADAPAQDPHPLALSNTPPGPSSDDAAESRAPIERGATASTDPSSAAEQLPLPADPSTGRPDVAAATAALARANSVGSGVGDDAAQAPGTDRIVAAAAAQTQLIDIETGTDHRSIAQDGSSQGNELLASQAERSSSLYSANRPARQMSANGSSFQLSPLQRSLVWRYLAQLEKINDPEK